MDADPGLAALGRAIKQVQWRHHRAGDRRLRAHGSTLVQWDALRAIDREPGATSRRLAAETFQTEQSFGVMAARMERNGLIVREHGTGRAIRHSLTDEGRRMLRIGTEQSTAVLTASLAALDGSERALLLGLLQRILGTPDPSDGREADLSEG